MFKSILYALALASTFATAIAQPFPKQMQGGDLKDPWTKNQLIEPAALAVILSNPNAAKPYIFNIGVVENIKGARKMGAASEKKNLDLFKKALTKIPKNAQVVVYCGCCPFKRCPNIRPAFQALKSAGFTNGRLLNLATNIKTDWISKGYPLAP